MDVKTTLNAKPSSKQMVKSKNLRWYKKMVRIDVFLTQLASSKNRIALGDKERKRSSSPDFCELIVKLTNKAGPMLFEVDGLAGTRKGADNALFA